MPKVKMLSGLPGSGKTTLARQIVEDSGNAGRVNRDDLRAMLFNSKWSGPREGVVIEVEKAIARVLLNHNMTPVVDDTNTLAKHYLMWSGFCKAWGAEIEVGAMKTRLDECIRRDSQREKPVGEAVINRMALWAGMIDFGTKPIVIVDFDGTLSDGTHRQGHLEGERKDWKAYFSKLSLDTPIEAVVKWVQELSKDKTICIVSGRPDTYQFESIAWLKKYNVPFDYILMRGGSDKRSDVDVKTDILNRLPKDQIEFCLDDRPVVVREVWRKNGVKVYPVQGGCEDF